MLIHDNMKMKNMDNMNMNNMNMDAPPGTMGHMEHMDMMMGSRWFTTFTKGPFLFELWLTNTEPGFVAAMLCSITLAILYDCMNYAFNVYHLRAERWHTRQNKVIAHVLLSLLRTVSVAIAYVTMLCAMSFNIWLLISIVVGSGVGHLVGRPLMAIVLQKEKKKSPAQAATELLHDFKDSDEYSGTNGNRQTVMNSRNFSSFEEKLLRYKYDDEET